MPALIKYLLLIIAGFAIIFCCSLFQHVIIITQGEYHYSLFLSKHYTVITAIIFFIAGIIVGYYWQLNPWGAGACMILIIPLVVIAEAIMYPGSHNLIPFELIMYFIYSLPAVAGVYIGKLILKQLSKRKSKHVSNAIN